jgi:hypothetical protein
MTSPIKLTKRSSRLLIDALNRSLVKLDELGGVGRVGEKCDSSLSRDDNRKARNQQDAGRGCGEIGPMQDQIFQKTTLCAEDDRSRIEQPSTSHRHGIGAGRGQSCSDAKTTGVK